LCPQETFMKPVLERKLHQIYEVVGFRSLGPYTLEIEFNDGISRKIDFEGVLEGELVEDDWKIEEEFEAHNELCEF